MHKWSNSVVTIEMDVMPPAFHHHQLFDHTSQLIGNFIYSSPYVQNDVSEYPHPLSLIESFYYNQQHTNCTFQLKPGLTWPDGLPLQSFAFTDSIHYFFSPSQSSTLQWCSHFIQGIKDYKRRQVHNISGVKVIDKLTFIIFFEIPCPFFHKLFEISSFTPIRMSDEGQIETYPGPYIIEKILPGEKGLLLRKNPQYPFHIASPDNIIFLITPNPEAGIELYKNEKIQLSCNTTFPPSYIPYYSSRKDFHKKDLKIAFQLQFNLKNKICNSVAFRKAIFNAVNREQICENLNHVIQPLYYYTELWHPDIDVPKPVYPKRAESLFNQAGIKSGQTLEIAYSNFPPNEEIVTAIIDQLSGIFPVHFIPKRLQYQEYIEALTKDRYEILLTLNPTNYNEPSGMLIPNIMDPKTQWVKQDYLSAITETLNHNSWLERLQAYNEINRSLFEIMPVVPLFKAQNIYLKKFSLGLDYNDMGFIQITPLNMVDCTKNSSEDIPDMLEELNMLLEGVVSFKNS